MKQPRIEKESHYKLIASRGKKCHRIRISQFSKRIESYFYTLKEATTFRDQILDNAEELIDLLPHLKMKSLKERCGAKDYGIVCEEIDDLHQKVDDLICYRGADINAPSNIVIKQTGKLTLGQAVTKFIAWRKRESREISTGELGRFKWWRDHSSLSNRQVKGITRDDILDERIDLQQNGGTRGTDITNSTINAYVKKSLSAIYTYLIDELQIIEIHYPRNIKGLKTHVIHTPAYSDDEIFLVIAAAYQLDVDTLGGDDTQASTNAFTMVGQLTELFSETGIRNRFLCQLRWDEIFNLDKADPMINKMMKGEASHMVPLSPRAIEILHEIKKKNLSDTFVFPSPRSLGQNEPEVPIMARTFTGRLKIAIANHNATKEPKIQVSGKPTHSFRSYIATRILDNGGNYDMICRTLGVTPEVAAGYAANTKKQRDAIRDLLAASRVQESDEVKELKRQIAELTRAKEIKDSHLTLVE